MSDRIQEQRPSALPYALGGAAVGGVGGYFGATKVDGLRKYVSEPAKYESFDALVEAANKADEFTKAAAEASEAEKPLMEQISTKVKEAEANWQKQLDEHIANGSKVADTDEIKVLEKELNELKAAQAKEVAAPATKTVTATKTPSANEFYSAELKSAREKIAKTKSDIKAYQTVQGWQKEMGELGRELTPAQKKEWLDFQIKIKQQEIENIKKLPNTSKQVDIATKELELLKSELKPLENIHRTEIVAPKSNKLEKLVESLTSESSEAGKTKEVLHGKVDGNVQSGKKLDTQAATNTRRITTTSSHTDSLSNKLVGDFKKEEPKTINGKKAKKTINVEKAKNAIQGKIDRNTQIGKELDALVDTNARRIAQTEPKASSEAIKRAEQAIEDKVNSLYGVTKEQKAELLKQAKAELTERTVAVERNLHAEQKLAALKAQFNDLPEAARKRFEERPDFIEHQIETKTASVEKLTQEAELAEKKVKLLEKRAKYKKNIQEAKMLDGKKLSDLTVGENKVINNAETRTFAQTLNAEEKELYEQIIKETRGRKAQTVVETVATDAKASTQNSAKIENLTKQIAEKRKALVGDSKANVEQLTKEFIEKNGSKETARNSAINSMKDDVAALFEGKINNKKLAIGVAAVATAGLALGLLLRPNAKEQA